MYFKNECFTECPPEISVFDEGECKACSDNCLTCKGQTDICDTCPAGQKLDIATTSCMSECPANISVDRGMTCEPCDDKCATCSATDEDYCTQCVTGLKLLEGTGDCVDSCPDGYAQIGDHEDSDCKRCADGCVDC